jgi:hypothetical protein
MLRQYMRESDKLNWGKLRKSGAIGDKYGKVVGEAYAFFGCRANADQVAEEVQTIMNVVRAPKGLELSLSGAGVLPAVSPRSINEDLIGIASDAREAGENYVLAARGLPTMSNRETADQLATVLNQAYQSPLYETGEKFWGEIVFKENGHYLFRE